MRSNESNRKTPTGDLHFEIPDWTYPAQEGDLDHKDGYDPRCTHPAEHLSWNLIIKDFNLKIQRDQ